MDKKENKKTGLKRIISSLVFGVIAAICVATAFAYILAHEDQKAAAQLGMDNSQIANTNVSTFIDTVNNNKNQGQNDSGAMLSSENYQIKQISFGGDISVDQGNNTDPLQVTDVRSELLMTKNQKDYRFLISWKTNKLAQSEIVYTKAGASEKSLKENGYGFVHSAVLTNLDAASTYMYTIKSVDQWGNVVTTDRYSMYTSEKSLSVFELIAKEFTGIFGWAMK